MMIRAFREADRPALRDICFQTALYGQPIGKVIADRELVAGALLGCYLRFERESLFVAEREERAVGYLAGCLDTRQFERAFACRMLPGLCWRFAAGGHVVRPRSWQVVMALLRTGLRRSGLMRAVFGRYPAHCHINLAAEARQKGIGSQLLAAFLAHCRARAVPGIHISTPSGPGKAFFAKAGFARLASYPAVPLGGVDPGEVWLMGKRLEE
jgi:GNAT superfamily N-acetyltransferase